MKYRSYRKIDLMKSRKVLNIGLLSVLLSTVAMGAEHNGCVGGVCFATLANIKPLKSIGSKDGSGCVGGVCFVPLSSIKPLKILEAKRGFEAKKEFEIKNEFEGIKFLEDNLDDTMDQVQPIVLESEEISEPLSDTNYVVNEEKVMDDLLMSSSIKVAEDKILEKTDLPSSDYFCEKDKQPVYLNNDIYECV